MAIANQITSKFNDLSTQINRYPFYGIPFIIRFSESYSMSDDTFKAYLRMTEEYEMEESYMVPFADLMVMGNYMTIPFGLHVSRESTRPLFPQTREITEVIPGRDGEFDFGTEFEARLNTLVCYSPDDLSKVDIDKLKQSIAEFLNPKNGEKTLLFIDEPEKFYKFKFSGILEPTTYPTWFQISLPLKSSDPHAYATDEQVLTANGVLRNKGNEPTGIIIEIDGASTNPKATLDGSELRYEGQIPSGSTVVIDTFNMTAYSEDLSGKKTNVLANVQGEFVMAQSGDNNLIINAGGGQMRVRMRSKWI